MAFVPHITKQFELFEMMFPKLFSAYIAYLEMGYKLSDLKFEVCYKKKNFKLVFELEKDEKPLILSQFAHGNTLEKMKIIQPNNKLTKGEVNGMK